ncbi:hypothetical protein EXIGLDRAFT_782171 [Exidia glandulosa HHB12029]|uniref:Uncharacterized protein n=1 Tax=Exidia glandulosa HHB12029 TaxID=1314781 RepID=A0A165AY73_EXIGL|nr:hypothetical protein EXIGLDRAFT_782171 [Exidia glandulosa HHB12029]
MAFRPSNPRATSGVVSPPPATDGPDDAPSRHVLAPDEEMVAFPLDSVKPYPDRVRYHVVWRAKDGRTFVAQNALAPVIPPPPDSAGPIGCDCRDHWGSTRYGSAQYDLRPWCPDFYRDGSGCVYAPDLFDGYGPCVLRSTPGLMTEWTDARTVTTDDSLDFDPVTISVLADYREVAVDVLSFLGVERAVHNPPSGAANQEDLWAAWSTWVRHEQELRAFILERLVGRDAYKRLQKQDRALWERLCECDYFQHGPVGTWFERAELHLAQIRFLLERGVPVFYEWTPALAAHPAAVFLAPANDAPPSDHAPEPAPTSALASSKRKGSDPPVVNSKVAKASSQEQPDNVDRTKRVVFNDADSLGRNLKDKDSEHVRTPPSTPKKSTSSAPSTPIRPLSARFTMPAVLYPSTAKSPSPAPRSPVQSTRAAALLNRLTSPTPSTVSGGSRASSPVLDPPAATPASLLARIQQPPPAPAVGVIEVVALCEDVGKPMHIETLHGALQEVELRLPPYSPTASEARPSTSPAIAALEYRINSDQGHPRLVFPSNGRAHEILLGAIARNEARTWVECLTVALQYGITVYTAIRTDAAPDALARAIAARETQAMVRVSPDLAPAARYASWRESIKSVLVKASALRATMRSGGLLWRLGRWFYGTATVDSHPTHDVYQLGSPVPIVINDQFYYDDWLCPDEENILLGWSPKLLPTHISLWPPSDIWNAHWGGIWVEMHETWFRARMSLIQGAYASADFKPFMTRHEWEQMLRGWKSRVARA